MEGPPDLSLIHPCNCPRPPSHSMCRFEKLSLRGHKVDKARMYLKTHGRQSGPFSPFAPAAFALHLSAKLWPQPPKKREPEVKGWPPDKTVGHAPSQTSGSQITFFLVPCNVDST
ncbi:uncharacterized protein CLUP02_03313 [Colletotrichum lupini]|uniref:Uncharacterized protein n=1 Tax=Colletotrichum lupini TaxID=145971 RepID=A0A9Q8WC82_9PEZI|nr:uncharacterized protein CLUP02_03313 [Colletotrichum lupini]UQC77841.1 hypothetical protein CLUP02_03313 [Colletotrichum lupini]